MLHDDAGGVARRTAGHRTASRELVTLGTASQVPTRTRNHNGYALFWDDDVILFDPGEGTQRQMLYAGVSASALTRIALTHLHGDHSLGLAGVVQRISLDAVPQTVPVTFPESGRRWVEALCDATAYYHQERLVLQGLTRDGVVPRVPGELHGPTVLSTARLDHSLEAYGYRLDEPDGRRMDPARLAAAGVAGPDVGRLVREGELRTAGGTVRVEDVSDPRPGQSFAFVMDTRLCDAVWSLAEGVDMLVIESTFLDRDQGLARDHGHLTALQAATVAAQSGVRSLVLTHFSQRYPDPSEFEREARTVFDDELTVAADLDRVPLPRRR
ncbi:ribonuclease Z [Promicromonospora thailandica]|uniref:Ribonuclease Z n=1 Tax=Promicromonospora thailandica TaxID=765201 RepID=A0A9X2GA40_9MICO|nr:ribonuclease Z [Promicromonospora thailandica]MCP2265376.1 ribonuclease Z [Promicromonospora thailandica]BFF16911.1 ribonuclease Z [Promicromonospora thailandica]